MNSWFRRLCDLLYPNLCSVCGRELNENELKICTFCRWDMPLTDFWLARENYVAELLAARFPFEQACAYIHFRSATGGYRRMIHRMKYGGRFDLAYMMGEMFGSALSQSPLYQDVDLIIPVPLHWSKRMLRGYNQSEELSLGMASQMKLEYNFGILKRVRMTRQQARRKSSERWRNVAGAFKVIDTQALQGRHVLLVDDVLTSGSTIEACAAALAECGCKISVATLAVAQLSQKHKR